MLINKTISPSILNKRCILCGTPFSTTKKAQIYCEDSKCQTKRAEIRKQLASTRKEESNLIILKGTFNNNQILRIQCHAHGPNGRCNEKFNVLYNEDRTVYPKYCHKHTNEYQRKTFEGKRNGSAECSGNQQTASAGTTGG